MHEGNAPVRRAPSEYHYRKEVEPMTGPEMAKQLEDIALHCVEECVRQNVGIAGLADLLNGYVYAASHADRLPTEDDLQDLAGIIEPSTRGRYRHTPVVFAKGGTAPAAQVIPASMERLFDPPTDPPPEPEEFVRAFLSIHPFSDGNGRTAFVLLNWLKGTLDRPVPLPDFDW